MSHKHGQQQLSQNLLLTYRIVGLSWSQGLGLTWQGPPVLHQHSPKTKAGCIDMTLFEVQQSQDMCLT